jgi:hypothetical protein
MNASASSTPPPARRAARLPSSATGALRSSIGAREGAWETCSLVTSRTCAQCSTRR